MSKRTISNFKASTSEIIRILDKNELSFRELLWNLHQDEKILSKNIKNLVEDGILTRKFHHHDIVYTLAHQPPIIQILHAIEQRLRVER